MPRFVKAKLVTKPNVKSNTASSLLGDTLRELMKKLEITMELLKKKVEDYIANTAAKFPQSIRSILSTKLFSDLTAKNVTPSSFQIAMKIMKQ